MVAEVRPIDPSAAMSSKRPGEESEEQPRRFGPSFPVLDPGVASAIAAAVSEIKPEADKAAAAAAAAMQPSAAVQAEISRMKGDYEESEVGAPIPSLEEVEKQLADAEQLAQQLRELAERKRAEATAKGNPGPPQGPDFETDPMSVPGGDSWAESAKRIPMRPSVTTKSDEPSEEAPASGSAGGGATVMHNGTPTVNTTNTDVSLLIT